MNFIQFTPTKQYATPKQNQEYEETGVCDNNLDYRWFATYSKNTTNREWTYVTDIIRDDLVINVYQLKYSYIGVVDAGERFRRVIEFMITRDDEIPDYITFTADQYTVDDGVLNEFLSIVTNNLSKGDINSFDVYNYTSLIV